MATDEFQIEFSYADVAYVGLVKPAFNNGQTWYTVDLESENREKRLQITLRPSRSTLEDWDFIPANEDDLDMGTACDRQLLTEIGEAIENYQLKGSDADSTTGLSTT